MGGKQEHIGGGYIILARQLSKSGIMEKPPLYFKLWVWLLLQASHTDHGSLKRGQLFTSLEKMRNAMAYKGGFAVMKPTIKEIRGFMNYITTSSMAVTMKGTRGTLITIQNYEYYQDFMNYEGHNGRHREGQTKNNTGNNNEGNKNPPADISSEISTLQKRYPEPEIINQVFQAISSTRQSNRIADGKKLSILNSWDQYTVESVMAGITTYLEKGYAEQGKDEKYLLGIIKNHKSENKDKSQGPIRKSTGSHALDEFYRSQGIRMI